LGAAALLCAVAAAAQAQVVLTASSWLQPTHTLSETQKEWCGLLEQRTAGKAKCNILPRAVAAPPATFDAVRNGLADLSFTVQGYTPGRFVLTQMAEVPFLGDLSEPNSVAFQRMYAKYPAFAAEHQGVKVLSVFTHGPGIVFNTKRPITKADDIKGLKYRTVGLAVDIFTDLGMAVNPLPGGEIVPALDRGLIDAAEFNNASSDRVLGFPDVVKNCMLQSFHQSGEQFEILFNKGKLSALPAELRSIIDYAVQASSAEMSWKAIDRNSKDYSEMKKQGIKFYKTPDAILKAQLDAWDKVVAKKSAENPFFKRVMDSQMAFAQRAGQWQNDYMVDFKMAYNRYFNKKA
jgi:TRAP-type mannitol/chloroaromatic compound transport system substrate-binding protein